VEFARNIFAADVINYLRTPDEKVTIFDRSVVDALGMLHECGGMSDQEIRSSLDRYPYNRLVFLFPPWEEIYAPDSERDQSFAEAEAVFDSLDSWYVRCGYSVVQVPYGTIEERCDFVRRLIAVGV